MAKENKNIGMLKNLAFAAEARADGGVTQPIEGGRFRYFFSTFKQNNGLLLLTNLLFLVTLLPLIAVFVVMTVFGVEQLGYTIHKIAEPPYFLSGVGIGLGSSASPIVAKAEMLDVYSWAFLFAGIGVIIASVGLSGIMPICAKFILKDSFISKKDSYGNDVPRVVKEFFLGIKKYWWQMLIVGLFMGVLVAGVGNAFTFFLAKFWLGAAGAGEWILIIFACIVAVFGAIFCIFMLPTIVMYDISFAQKMKNAAIFTLQMFIQNFFILIIVALPFVLMAVTSGFINIILVALMLVFGAPFYCLLISNYVQYYSEKIITPVYRAQFAKSKKDKKAQKNSQKRR